MKKNQLLSKLNVRNISLLTRIYISFIIVIAFFAVTSVVTYSTQTLIGSAFSSVESESQPVEAAAVKLEIAMYNANQDLLKINTALTPADITSVETQFKRSSSQLSIALDELKDIVNKSTTLAEYDNEQAELNKSEYVKTPVYIDQLTKYVDSYLKSTSTVASERKDFLVQKEKAEKRQANFFSLINLMAVDIERINSELQDSFIFMLVSDLTAIRTRLERNLHGAFNASDSETVLKNYNENQQIIKNFQEVIGNITRDAPKFKDLESPYFEPLYKDASTNSGILYKFYELVKVKEALDKKANESAKAILEAKTVLEQLQAKSDSFAKYSSDNVNGYINLSLELVFGSLAFVLLITVIILFTLARSIKRPLEQLITVLDRVAEGDLTSTLTTDDSKDEFSKIAIGVNKMTEQIRIVVAQLKHAVNSLQDTANQNVCVVNDSNEALDVQRKEAIMVASSTAELEQTLAQVVESSQQTLQEVNNVGIVSEQGRQIMSDNITTTHTLDSKLKQTSEAITLVNQMGDKIGNVVAVITGIAEQTNLLALNAAIEAARAGEQGRGFAVVADEVRTLATRTRDSTTEITQVITELRNTITTAVNVIATCNEEMQASLTQSSKANSAIEEIMGYIATIEQMTSQIVESAHQQEIATKEINQNITRITALADQNYDGMCNIQKSSEVIDSIAKEQTDIVNMFKI